jgi:hypothetical protein
MPEVPREVVPEQLRKFVDAASPIAMRTMAAKGLVPIPPKDLVFVQCVLAGSDDAKLAEAADKSLRAHPDAILKPIVKADLPSVILDLLADRIVERAALVEDLLLNRAVSDDTLARITPSLAEPSVALLIQNEERILRSPPLVLALKAHPLASKAAVDRMFDQLVRSGVILDGVAEFTEALLRLTSDERIAAVANIEVPQDLLDPAFRADAPAAEAPPAVTDDMPEMEAVATDEPAEEEEKELPFLKRLSTMTIAQKVAVALKGNKEVRTTLLRDSNKLVAVAAIKNPRITDQEVVTAAGSKSANEEVLRIICQNREWTRSYSLKLALVMNPKTPVGVAMRFMALLNQSDLKNIAKSKNLPSAIANQAKAMMSRVGK